MSIVTAEDSANLSTAMRTPASRPNVGAGERTVSAAAGAALVLLGALSPKSRAPLVTAGGMLLYRGLSGNCLVYRAMGVDHGVSHDQAAIENRHGVHFDRSIVIAKPPEAIFAYWRNFKALPQLIDHLSDVTMDDTSHSRWTAKGPLGIEYQWDAEIIEERPNEFLAWRSCEGADVATAGSLHLKALSHDRGTAVRLVMTYDPPGGRLAATLASWLGTDVEGEIFEGLRRMKQILEAGEISTIENQPIGNCGRLGSEGGKS